MRMLLVSLTVIAAALAAAGCDKPEPEADLDVVDASAGGGAPAPAVWVDRSILDPRPAYERPAITPLVTTFDTQPAPQPQPQPQDQPMAATNGTDAAMTTVGPAMASADEPAELKEVRQAVGSLARSQVDRIDLDVIVDAFVADQAVRLRQLAARFDGVIRAVAELREVGTPILGEDPFILLGEQAGGAMAPGPAQVDADMGPEEAIAMMTGTLPLERISATEVALLEEDGSPSGVVFRKVSGRWLIALPEEALAIAEQVINDPATDRLLNDIEGICQVLTTDLQNGNITAETFAATAMNTFQMRAIGSLMAFQGAMTRIMAQSQQPAVAESSAPDAETTTDADSAYGDDAYGGPSPW